MKFKEYNINFTLLALTAAILCLMSMWTESHLILNSDILSTMPVSDPVLNDAKKIFDSYRLPDKVAIDLSMDKNLQPDKDVLSSSADYLETEMEKSGLFENIELADPMSAFIGIVSSVSENLPLYFSRRNLEKDVKPVLNKSEIQNRLNEDINLLGGFEGVGQSDMISKDPLGLRFIILQRLQDFFYVKGSSIYKGHIFSEDGRHILVSAQIKSSGIDIKNAAKIAGLFQRISGNLKTQPFSKTGKAVKINAIGSFQATLDNEHTARRDVILAVSLSTIGIVILLLVCFPRPLIGIFSLLPAFAGTITALFVISIIKPSMSTLALGFGGTILSFTVDYGIAFLLFLDRTSKTTGRGSSNELWSAQLLATVTTVGSFMSLYFTGFEIMAEVGLYSALGATFSFIFVHTIMPLIFRDIPPAKRGTVVPIERIANAIALKGGWPGFVVAIGFVSVMVVASKPVFNADLNAINTVSENTIKMENAFKRTWGDITSRIIFLSTGGSIDEIRRYSDKLAMLFEEQKIKGNLISSFTFSDILPGDQRASHNINEWKSFWNKARTDNLKDDITSVCNEVGFKPDAFDPFFSLIKNPDASRIKVEDNDYTFLGLLKDSKSKNRVLISTATPGPSYDPHELFRIFHSAGLGYMLDYRLFTSSLSGLLQDIFIKIILFVGGGLIIVLIFYYMDLTLTLLTLLPVTFSIICTLGTYSLLGHPIDIPGLLFVVVILGMGVNYPIYTILIQQRYFDEYHPSMGTIRAIVMLTATTTLIGFSVLVVARHHLLASAGLAAILGVIYTYIGTNLLLPPILRIIYQKKPFQSVTNIEAGSITHRKMVLSRFKHLEVYARMFARFKMKFDPMFSKLAGFIKGGGTVLDIGCGYGVQGVWLKTLIPGMKICALDPDRERIRIAKRVLDPEDVVYVSTAQEFKAYPQTIDTALMLDMIHYISDEDLKKILGDIKSRLTNNGRLILRVTIPSEKKVPWERWLEIIRNRVARNSIWLRSIDDVSTLLKETGYKQVLCEATAPGREETWFVSEPAAGSEVL